MVTGKKHIRRCWRGIRSKRRGTAVVEMAIVTPVLLALLFGIMEYGWVFMVQSSLTNSVREACRVGILPGATDAEIRDRFEASISTTGLDLGDCTLEISQPAPGADPQVLSVQASVPWANVTLFGALPQSMLSIVSGGGSSEERTANMVAACSMLKEGSH